MYQSLLTRRYLLSKIMPMLAIVCVMLCSALLLFAWSIMGGFLVMLTNIGRTIEGDVTISWPTAGFGHYDDLIARLEKDPLVEAAAPMIETFGMVTLADDRALGVRIKGIDERFAKVSEYASQVWWKPIDEPLPKDIGRIDPRLTPAVRAGFEQTYQDGLTLTRRDRETGRVGPAAVLGIEMSGFTIRKPGNVYVPAPGINKRRPDGKFADVPGWTILQSITIRVIPMDSQGRDLSTFASRTLPIANEYRTGLFETDKNSVLVNLSELQRMLKMHASERLSDEKPKDPYAVSGEGAAEKPAERAVVGVEPARVTSVVVKGKKGVESEKLRARCVEIWDDFSADHDDVPSAQAMAVGRGISTWERQIATFVSAVKKETAMVVGMLLFMSVVYAVLILSIFWAMVSEKTKDIGILRAVGAGRSGVAWLWLRYGLIIGVAGGLAGLLLGSTVVWNINPIHDWLGERMGISLWDPNVYYFPTIPNVVEPFKAALVGCSAVFFCTLGALVPAIRAARMDPVRALRFE